MPLSQKSQDVVVELRRQAAKFGRNSRPEDAAQSRTVAASRRYGIERSVLAELALAQPAACGPSIKECLTAPASKWSEPKMLEVLLLADALEGQPVTIPQPAAVVEPLLFDDEPEEPEGQ